MACMLTPEKNNSLTQMVLNHDNKELHTSQYSDYNMQDLEYHIDPDNNFFSSILNNCGYYTDEQFNSGIDTEGKLSIIHFNSRSLYTNFTAIKEYLQQLSQSFSVIAVSET
ncbi:hypothetical protein NL108_004700 [Boleophthalmus pectinirostris]|nr:hypothetical protein NL108_004700 [Boleophthalmus pectinirostris]